MPAAPPQPQGSCKPQDLVDRRKKQMNTVANQDKHGTRHPCLPCRIRTTASVRLCDRRLASCQKRQPLAILQTPLPKELNSLELREGSWSFSSLLPTSTMQQG